MSKILTIVSVLALGLMVACTTPNTPSVVVTPTGPATSAELTALNVELAALRASFASRNSLDDIAAAGVWAAQEANKLNPVGLPKEATAAQLEEAAKALPTVSDAKKLEKTNQNARILAGQLEAVKAEMGQKATEIEKLKADKAESDKRAADVAAQLVALSAKAETERNDAADKLQKQFDNMSAKIKTAQNEANNKVMLAQVSDLNKAAMACAGLLVLVVGAGSIFGGVAGLRMVAPLAVLLLLGALICFGLAQIIALWWFKWAVLFAVCAILGLCAWYVIKHYKMGTLQADTAEKAAKLTGVLTQTIPVLDKAYNDAEGEVKKFMDEHIFTPLNDKMDAKDKAVVHEIRAVVADPATPKT